VDEQAPVLAVVQVRATGAEVVLTAEKSLPDFECPTAVKLLAPALTSST
jgi:hypothetical protein